MADFESDDPLWQVRLPWLGPPGHTIPVQMPFRQWVLGLSVLMLVVGPTLLITREPLIVTTAACTSTLITKAIWARVSYDRTARQVLRTLLRDWRRTPPAQAGPLPKLSTRNVRIGKDTR